MSKLRFQAPPGMHDLLPEDQFYFRKIYDVVEEIADFYGFEKIDTPIAEQADLFSRGIGISTDIVEKQMYTFRTKGDDYLALRPEGTAPVVRAYLEHGMFNLPHPVKLWYFGPFFRYERPQEGRFRQFHQFGLEILGDSNPVLDAQTIQIFLNILEELKFRNLTLEVNSIGDNQCRPYYKKSLASYFKHVESQLCSDCRRRLKENPLRVLDCKEEKCQRIISQAPQMVDYFCEECKAHFKRVLEFLEELGVSYNLNPLLSRGLDYYTKTVFEIFDADEKSAGRGGALVGGGRYDILAKIVGGKEIPACGAAGGIERIIALLKTRKVRGSKFARPKKVFLAQLGDLARRKCLKLFEILRDAQIPVAENLSKDSLKGQMRTADRLGADFALILGQKEALEGTIIIRDMKTGKQEILRMEKLVSEIKRRLR